MKSYPALRSLSPIFRVDERASLDVSIAAGRGDALAKRVYEFTGKILGEACADFATFSSPEAFIFFGGLTKAGDLLMEPIMRSYKEHALEIFKDKPKFLVSSLDDGISNRMINVFLKTGTDSENIFLTIVPKR